MLHALTEKEIMAIPQNRISAALPFQTRTHYKGRALSVVIMFSHSIFIHTHTSSKQQAQKLKREERSQ
jgi:hypothetical protein